MDKSRSSRHYQEFPKLTKNKSETNLPNIDGGLKVTINQKEGKSNKNNSPKKGKNNKKSPASAKNKSASKTNIKSKSPKSTATTKKKK